MTINWIGDDRDVVASVDKYRLHIWRTYRTSQSADNDWSWTVAIDNGPLARGFADTVEDAKAAALEAVEDHRSGGLQ
jgi:hypothetical protein